SSLELPFRAPAGALRGTPALGRPELHAGPACLRQPDRDRLLGRPSAVLALADVVHLLANELACLRGRCLTLAPISLGALDGFLLRHDAPPVRRRCNGCAGTTGRKLRHVPVKMPTVVAQILQGHGARKEVDAQSSSVRMIPTSRTRMARSPTVQ